MFKHIGRKVRGLAVALCVIGMLGAVGAAVYLYLSKTMQLVPCILIGVGGLVVSWIVSWVMYAIGDTHAKLERLEDKLVPKPNYSAYLAENTALRGACEICGRITDLIPAKIEDKMGTRYRKVCRECFAANNCKEAE